MTDNIIFFETFLDMYGWLEQHHDGPQELWVGFYKKGSGKPSVTWPESVDAALCFGWIDGLRKGIDEVSYKIRFTPRKKTSIWSSVNVKRVAELQSLGMMRPTGQKAFEGRSEAKTAIYAYEQESPAELDPADERQFRENAAAWEFFQAQPAWYKRTAIYRITSAKKEETKRKRLIQLIEDSAQKLTIDQFRGRPK